MPEENSWGAGKFFCLTTEWYTNIAVAVFIISGYAERVVIVSGILYQITVWVYLRQFRRAESSSLFVDEAVVGTHQPAIGRVQYAFLQCLINASSAL